MVEQGCQPAAPSLVHLPGRWRGELPWQVSQLQTQGSVLGGLPFPRLVSSPEVPFVGGVLDVVANVVEHSMSRGAVAGIKHLEEVHCGTDGLLLPSSAPPGQPSHWRRAQKPLQLLPLWSSEHLTTLSNQKNPLKVGMECK